MNETVLKPTATAIQDPSLGKNVSDYVSTFGERVSKAGQEGFQFASKWIANPAQEWDKMEATQSYEGVQTYGESPSAVHVQPGILSRPPPVATSTGYGSTIAPVEERGPASPGWDDWNAEEPAAEPTHKVDQPGSHASPTGEKWDDF